MNTPLRVGVVGIGAHFRETLFLALLSTDSVFAALCDNREEGRHWASQNSLLGHCLITETLEDPAFWNNIDCVVCCSWPEVHERVLTEAIKRGKHCFCEKPAALTSANLEPLIESCPDNLVIRVGHVFRYSHGGEAFLEKLQSHKPTCILAQYVGSRPRGGRWNLSAKRAFSLTHLTHAVDFIIAAAGLIEGVLGVNWESTNETETVTAVFKTERCSAVTLWATNAAPAFNFHCRAILERGEMIEMSDLREVRITGLTSETKRSGPFLPGLSQGGDYYRSEFVAFLLEVQGLGKCLLPSLSDAYHVLSVLEVMESWL